METIDSHNKPNASQEKKRQCDHNSTEWCIIRLIRMTIIVLRTNAYIGCTLNRMQITYSHWKLQRKCRPWPQNSIAWCLCVALCYIVRTWPSHTNGIHWHYTIQRPDYAKRIKAGKLLPKIHVISILHWMRAYYFTKYCGWPSLISSSISLIYFAIHQCCSVWALQTGRYYVWHSLGLASTPCTCMAALRDNIRINIYAWKLQDATLSVIKRRPSGAHHTTEKRWSWDRLQNVIK